MARAACCAARSASSEASKVEIYERAVRLDAVSHALNSCLLILGSARDISPREQHAAAIEVNDPTRAAEEAIVAIEELLAQGQGRDPKTARVS